MRAQDVFVTVLANQPIRKPQIHDCISVIVALQRETNWLHNQQILA